jgi:hypothetical protein
MRDTTHQSGLVQDVISSPVVAGIIGGFGRLVGRVGKRDGGRAGLIYGGADGKGEQILLAVARDTAGLVSDRRRRRTLGRKIRGPYVNLGGIGLSDAWLVCG